MVDIRSLNLTEHPSLLRGGDQYPCFADICQTGTQYCNILERRCHYCMDYFRNCFTAIQQQNCTQYCMDQLLQNIDTTGNAVQDDDCAYQVPFFISLSINIILVILVTLICIPKVRKSMTCFQNIASNNSDICNRCGNLFRNKTGSGIQNTLRHASKRDSGSNLGKRSNGHVRSTANDADGSSFEERSTADGGIEDINEASMIAREQQRQTTSHQVNISPDQGTAATQPALTSNNVAIGNTPSSRPTSATGLKQTVQTCVTVHENRNNMTDDNSTQPLLGNPHGEISRPYSDGSVTQAKTVRSGSLNRPLANELSNNPGPSNGYPAINQPTGESGYKSGVSS